MKVIINILLAVVFFATAYGVGNGADISECIAVLLAMFGIKEIANAADELNDMGL